MPDATPSEQDAIAVAEHHLGETVRAIARFPTGLAHWVYDVLLSDGRRVAVRLGRSEQGADFASAAAWHRLLTPSGVPLPRLLAHDARPAAGGFPFMVTARLPGRDLGDVYPTLTADQKGALDGEVAAIQRRVGELPLGPGFGYARSYADRGLHPTWEAVLEASLARSRERIAAAGVVAPDVADGVARKLPEYAPQLARVAAVPFLDDTTTKNVIVHAGRLSGIVDVDRICFGDPLLTVALTHMALLSSGSPTDYVAYWADELGLNAERHALLTLYTAIFCVDFLSELGQRFNRDEALPAGASQVAHLLGILNRLLAII